jgi:hypothetical protein
MIKTILTIKFRNRLNSDIVTVEIPRTDAGVHNAVAAEVAKRDGLRPQSWSMMDVAVAAQSDDAPCPDYSDGNGSYADQAWQDAHEYPE